MVNYLRIVYHCHICKFIVWIGQQAPSLVLLLATTQIYKNGDYELCFLFYGAQDLPDLLLECHQLPFKSIVRKTLIQNFN